MYPSYRSKFFHYKPLRFELIKLSQFSLINFILNKIYYIISNIFISNYVIRDAIYINLMSTFSTT